MKPERGDFIGRQRASTCPSGQAEGRLIFSGPGTRLRRKLPLKRSAGRAIPATMPGVPDAPPPMGRSEHLMSRRRVIAAAGVGSVALLLRPSLIFGGGDAGGPDVEPQPYFAGVNRAVGELAGLGAPLAPQDAAQIAAMS